MLEKTVSNSGFRRYDVEDLRKRSTDIWLRPLCGHYGCNLSRIRRLKEAVHSPNGLLEVELISTRWLDRTRQAKSRSIGRFNPPRIAVVGGGIAGLVTALSLHHHCRDQGIKVDVYEQAPQYKEIGAGVGIGPNAARILGKIGLFDKAYEIAGKRKHVWISFRPYDNGDDIVTIPAYEEGKVKQTPVHRAEFLELLVSEIQTRGAATLHSNKQCQKLEDRGETMTVTFADGTTATADLVIGADGIHSNNDDARFGGMVVYRGLCPISKLEDWWPLESYSAAWLTPGKHFLVFPISQNKILNIVGFVTTKKEDLGDARESWTLTSDKESVRKEFAEFNSTVQRIIEYMNTNPLKWLLYDRQSFKRWVFAGGKAREQARPSRTPTSSDEPFRTFASRSSQGHSLEDWLQPVPAGDVYEMVAKELQGLSYEECLPIVKKLVENRMTWIWSEDVSSAYERARHQL
ncbi:hypothetical protein VTN00DRAFT_3832 [Thermoascus crustaceus]|uniref:uncharacterized protein n=1 Tax=Thermoascus crustaceus TaxID=5088 RepID=UPI003742ABBC